MTSYLKALLKIIPPLNAFIWDSIYRQVSLSTKLYPISKHCEMFQSRLQWIGAGPALQSGEFTAGPMTSMKKWLTAVHFMIQVALIV